MDGDFNVGRWRGEGRALLNQRLCCVRGKTKRLTRLLEYALPVPLKSINDVTYSTTVKHLSSSQVEKTFIAVPPEEKEQSTIATFLDRETAKIDALVAEQHRLIELLKEKRQAVISHAVTKGLTNLPGANLNARACDGGPEGERRDSVSSPDAPMKDSGIEWLGEVPEHWAVSAVRRILQRIEQGWSPECINRPAESGEWGVLKSGCVNRGKFIEYENKALPDNLKPLPEYQVQEGDVLMSRASGSPELVGSVAFVMKTRPNLMLSDKIFRLRLSERIQPRFFALLFNSKLLRAQIERSISGAEGLANNLPQASIKTFRITLPPIAEQDRIVAFVDRETAKLDTLTAEAQSAITLLQERRTALISAAVTGKIDVRGLAGVQAPNEALQDAE